MRTPFVSICVIIMGGMPVALSAQHVKTVSPSTVNYKIIPADSAERAMFITPPVNGLHYIIGMSTKADRMGDIMLRTVDKDLTVTMDKNLGVPGFDMGFSALVTSDEHIVLAGFTTNKSHGGLDGYLMKINLQGDTLWTRRVGGPDDDRFIRVIECDDKGYLAVGQTSSWGNGSIDGLLTKFDRDGQLLWKVTIGDELLDRTYSLATASNGDFIVTGITNANYPGNSDILIARIDNTGKLLWKKKTGGPKGDISHAMIPKDKTSFVSIGYTAEYSSPLSDPLIVHFDEHGNILGNYSIQSGHEIRLMDGYFVSSDKLLCAGYIRDAENKPWDIAVVEFDFKSRNFSISRLAFGSEHDEAFHLAPLDKNTAVIVGYTSNTPSKKGNMFLLKWPVKK